MAGAAVAGVAVGAVAGAAVASAAQPAVVYAPPPVVYAPPPVVYAAPPPVMVGTVVYALPAGCPPVVVNGVQYFSCGGGFYRPVYMGGGVAYQVVPDPDSRFTIPLRTRRASPRLTRDSAGGHPAAARMGRPSAATSGPT